MKKPKKPKKRPNLRHSLSREHLAASCATDAREYLKAAELLNDSGHRSPLWPRYFLLSQALELILKAYIALHGGDEGELRKIGHRLLLAYACAHRRGLIFPDPRILKTIHSLHLFHKGLFFRYRQPIGFVQLPEPRDLSEIIATLVSQIDSTIRQHLRSRRREP